jgi:hypothetical protein
MKLLMFPRTNLETDVQFGVTQALIGKYVRHENGVSK